MMLKYDKTIGPLIFKIKVGNGIINFVNDRKQRFDIDSTNLAQKTRVA